MGEIVISEEEMGLISEFEKLSGASSRDCVIDEKFNRILFVINPGEMGLAIGKKGASVKKAADAFGKKVEVVEYNEDKVQFLRNCFLPVQIQTVTFVEKKDDGTEVAYIEVPHDVRGLAIGKEGRNIIKAKILALRQFDIAHVDLLPEEEEESDMSKLDDMDELEDF